MTSASTDMTGGGTGTSGGSVGSGRAHFRSQTGCCICGTKSSSSRFTASQRFAEHFGACFGSGATARSGDLCNACVLCVKRWLQRGKQPNLFVQVLDSKKGPGPKHMKEITKRARRREARQAAAAATTSNPKLHHKTSTSTTSCLGSNTSISNNTNTNHSHLGVVTNPKAAVFGTRSSGSSLSSSHYLNGNSPGRTHSACCKHPACQMNVPNLNSQPGFSIETRSHGLLSSSSNPHLPNSEPRYHSRSTLNGSTASSALMGLSSSSSNNLLSKSCNTKSAHVVEPCALATEVESSKGAARTRAAAARQQEALNTRAAAASRMNNNNLRSSTPSRCQILPNRLSPTTPSETSEYGSFSLGLSSRASSISSSSRCCGCVAGTDLNGNWCAYRSAGLGQGHADSEKCELDELQSHCQCNTHNHHHHHHKLNPNGSSALSDDAPNHPDPQSKDCCYYSNQSACCPCSCSCCCCLGPVSAASSPCSCSYALHDPIQCCTSEFRHPYLVVVPQSNGSSATTTSTTNLMDNSDAQSNSSQLSPASSLTTSTAPTTRRYNRRVVLPPIKMTPNPELDSLLRDIMERNSQAINYDSREMHMAVQRCLRLRSRTIQAASASGSASGRASSISSADGSIDAVLSTNSQLGSAKAGSSGPADSIDTGFGRSSSHSLSGIEDGGPPLKRRCTHVCSHRTDLSLSENKTAKFCCHHHHHHHCHAHNHHHPQQQQPSQPQQQRQQRQSQEPHLDPMTPLPHHQLRHSRLSFQPYSTPHPRKS